MHRSWGTWRRLGTRSKTWPRCLPTPRSASRCEHPGKPAAEIPQMQMEDSADCEYFSYLNDACSLSLDMRCSTDPHTGARGRADGTRANEWPVAASAGAAGCGVGSDRVRLPAPARRVGVRAPGAHQPGLPVAPATGEVALGTDFEWLSGIMDVSLSASVLPHVCNLFSQC